MNEYEQIDDYLGNRLTADDRAAFEESLQTNPSLADAVAFYLLTHQVAKQEAADARKAEWARQYQRQTPVRRLGGWAYAVAASIVVLVGLGWYFWGSMRPTATELADSYMNTAFRELDVAMDTQSDSLKQGVALFNDGKLTEAGVVFNGIYERNPSNDTALKYSGIVSLRQGNYDKAIEQFHRLSLRTELLVNPGMFYEALTLMKRNQPDDEATARRLLQTVVEKKLEGEKVAKEWINALN